MKRGTKPMKRTRMRRHRDRAVKGRIALRPSDYKKLREQVLERDGYRCQACVALGFKDSGKRLEVHHVVKRSQGGADDGDNLVTLCGGEEGCHRWTDEAYSHPGGRLIVAPEGNGRFSFRAVRGQDKWEVLMQVGPGEGIDAATRRGHVEDRGDHVAPA